MAIFANKASSYWRYQHEISPYLEAAILWSQHLPAAAKKKGLRRWQSGGQSAGNSAKSGVLWFFHVFPAPFFSSPKQYHQPKYCWIFCTTLHMKIWCTSYLFRHLQSMTGWTAKIWRNAARAVCTWRFCPKIGYHLVMTNSLPWKITMLLIGKPSISMGYFLWLC